MSYPLASAGLRLKDVVAAVKILMSGNLTMGNHVREFEERFARYLGVNHFVMMNSGSSANLAIIETLLRGLNSRGSLNTGDGVIVPSIAWPTTVWPILQLGLRPIFIDIDTQTIGLDLARTREYLQIFQEEERIRAIMPIHALGFPLDSEELEKLAHDFGLVLIEDCCESLGALSRGKHVGQSAIASSFSFYFSHHMTTMEGGGVATNSSAVADDLMSIRAHGWTRNRANAAELVSDKNISDARFTFVSTGFNVRPMEIQGAIGKSQLADLERFVERRIENATYVASHLKNSIFSVHGLDFDSSDSRHSRMMLPIIIDERYSRFRDFILTELERKGVETRPVLTGNFLNQPAMQIYSNLVTARGPYDNSNWISQNAFLVGNYHDVKRSKLDFLIRSLSEISQQTLRN